MKTDHRQPELHRRSANRLTGWFAYSNSTTRLRDQISGLSSAPRSSFRKYETNENICPRNTLKTRKFVKSFAYLACSAGRFSEEEEPHLCSVYLSCIIKQVAKSDFCKLKNTVEVRSAALARCSRAFPCADLRNNA